MVVPTQLSLVVVAVPLRSLGIWHQNVVSDCLVLTQDNGTPWGAALTDGSCLFGDVYMLPKVLYSGFMQDATRTALHGLWIRCLYILT